METDQLTLLRLRDTDQLTLLRLWDTDQLTLLRLRDTDQLTLLRLRDTRCSRFLCQRFLVSELKYRFPNTFRTARARVSRNLKGIYLKYLFHRFLYPQSWRCRKVQQWNTVEAISWSQ